MESIGLLEGFLWGVFGGIASEVFVWYNEIRKPSRKIPNPSRWLSYWISTILRILIGGGLVVAYIRSNMPLTPILAMHVGVTTPLIIAALRSQTPPIEPGTSN